MPETVWWHAVAIVIAGTATYWNSLHGPFVFDDTLSITGNPDLRTWWSLASLFPGRELPASGRPIANLTFGINYAIGGLNVVGYHVANIAIHLACALLLFGIVRRTLELPSLRGRFPNGAVNLAFATALIWTLHPLNTEVVDYVTERMESLMAVFYLLTLYASVRASQTQPPVKWLSVAVLSCLAGMACKETMATVPVMVVLYDRIFLFDSLEQTFRSRWRFYVALVLTLGVLVALEWSGPRMRSVGFGTDVSPWTYLLNQTLMISHYLRLVVWPLGMVLMYGGPLPFTLLDVLPYAVFITALGLLTIAALYWWPKAGFLGAWVFVTLAPASSFVPITTEVGAERRMYLPLMALATLGVVGVDLLWDFLRRRLAGADSAATGSADFFAKASVLVVIALALAGATVSRNREYASGLSLAETVLERWPTSLAHRMVGTELVMAGRREEGIVHLREAARGDPRAHYELGTALYELGRLDESIEELRVFVREEPHLFEVIPARETLAHAFAQQGKWPEVVAEVRQLVKMAPSNPRFRGLLADALFEAHEYAEAGALYRESLESRPDNATALGNLGISLAQTNNLGEAIEMFRRALALQQQNHLAHRNLAQALLAHHDVGEAAVQAQQALALKPDDPVTLDLLGQALAMQGKLDEAQVQFQRSLALDPTSAETRERLAQVQRLRGFSPK